VLGINIQKEEITKNKSDVPKNIFRKNNGSFVFALCKCVILSKINGNFSSVIFATPVDLS
jgi:hypothetical protein